MRNHLIRFGTKSLRTIVGINLDHQIQLTLRSQKPIINLKGVESPLRKLSAGKITNLRPEQTWNNIKRLKTDMAR